MVGQQSSAPRQRRAKGVPARTLRGRPPQAPQAKPDDDDLFVNSVAKAFQVFYAFGAQHASLSLTEIAEATGMGVSAAQRFVHTLHRLGYLRKDERTRRYRLGVRLLDFSFLYQRSNALTEIAIQDLVGLSERSDETVHMVERDGADIVYIARLPRHEVRLTSGVIGTRMPAFCTGSGRAMLSALPEAEAAALVESADRTPLTAATVTDPAEIMAALREARRLGYALIDGEVLAGEMALAAPVFDYAGAVVAAVGIVVPTSRWTPERVARRLAPMVVEAARSISRALGDRRAFTGS
jgi:IclR family transcriptional regulator, pca regulon regulatory protein